MKRVYIGLLLTAALAGGVSAEQAFVPFAAVTVPEGVQLVSCGNGVLGDGNCDCVTDINDLILVHVFWGGRQGENNYNPAADPNKDGVIDWEDELLIGDYLGYTCQMVVTGTQKPAAPFDLYAYVTELADGSDWPPVWCPADGPCWEWVWGGPGVYQWEPVVAR